MNIIILNKRLFNEFMTYNFVNDDNVESQDMLIISINEFYKKETWYQDDYNVNSYFKRQHSNVLIEHFGDYREDYITECIKKKKPTSGFFSEHKAKRMYEFMMRNKDKSLAVLHCGAGISRSGAAGQFLWENFGTISYEDFKRKNKKIEPNNHILRLLNEQKDLANKFLSVE